MATPMIRMDAKSMYTVVKNVSPDLARTWLEHNTENRPLRHYVVSNFASLIKRGEWRLTHQGIAFDERGVLLDGQHRLAAIAHGAVDVPVAVTYNAPRDSFGVIDTHQKRSVGDATGLNKIACSVAAAMVRVGLGKKPSRETSIGAAEALAGDVDELLTYCGSARNGISSAFQAGVVARAIETGNKEFCYGSYRSFVLLHFDSMTPLQQALYKQQQSVVNWTKKHKVDPTTETFARAAIAFNPASVASRVMIRDFSQFRELAAECLRVRGVL